MNLYKLNAEFEKMLTSFVDVDDTDFLVDENTGEVVEQSDYQEMLNSLSLEREEKIKNCLLYIKSLNAQADSVSNEIARLQKLKKLTTNKAESFSAYVLDALNVGEKIDFDIVKVICSKGLESVEIVNDADIPEEFCRVELKPKKAEIKKALKNGIDVAGAELVKKEKRMIVK